MLLSAVNPVQGLPATGGRPFRFLLLPLPHVADEASAAFACPFRFLRMPHPIPSDNASYSLASLDVKKFRSLDFYIYVNIKIIFFFFFTINV